MKIVNIISTVLSYIIGSYDILAHRANADNVEISYFNIFSALHWQW